MVERSVLFVSDRDRAQIVTRKPSEIQHLLNTAERLLCLRPLGNNIKAHFGGRN